MEGSIAAPFMGMVLAECAQVGLMIVSKVAMAKGMSNFIFVFYSNAIASVVLLPASFFFHRSPRPQLTFGVLGGFFLLGLLGCLAQIFGYAGINYSSPTLGTAMLNLIPGFTFMLAVCFSMENLQWGSSKSLAKAVGTVVSISGAFIITLYKGPSLLKATMPSSSPHQLLLFQQSSWVTGGLFLVADCVMASAWLIVQVSILKKYPAELIVVFFYCFFVAIQSAVICLVAEKDPSAWSLESNFKLIAVLYSAVFGSAFQVGISTWCLHKTGPVFVSMFKPLGIVIAVCIGVIFFGDTLYLGSIIGATVIVIGFYSVMWGKAKEQKMREESCVRSLESTGQKAPLLQSLIR